MDGRSSSTVFGCACSVAQSENQRLTGTARHDYVCANVILERFSNIYERLRLIARVGCSLGQWDRLFSEPGCNLLELSCRKRVEYFVAIPPRSLLCSSERDDALVKITRSVNFSVIPRNEDFPQKCLGLRFS